MPTFVIDKHGDFVVKSPKFDSDIIQIGEKYLAYENSLPVEEQVKTPPLATVYAAYQAAVAAAAQADTGEHSRATASSHFKQNLDAMKKALRRAIDGLAWKYSSDLATLEAWGVNTVLAANGLRIAYPTRRQGWMSLMDAYIAREENLPPESRWQDPPLSEMEDLREAVVNTYDARESAVLTRRVNIDERRQHADKLSNLLDLALFGLILLRFDGKVNLQLANWGYQIINRPPNSNGQGETAVEPTPSEPTTG